MVDVMYVCVIMHDMIFEDDNGEDLYVLTLPNPNSEEALHLMTCKSALPINKILKHTHNLRDDLVKHNLWNEKWSHYY